MILILFMTTAIWLYVLVIGACLCAHEKFLAAHIAQQKLTHLEAVSSYYSARKNPSKSTVRFVWHEPYLVHSAPLVQHGVVPSISMEDWYRYGIDWYMVR